MSNVVTLLSLICLTTDYTINIVLIDSEHRGAGTKNGL